MSQPPAFLERLEAKLPDHEPDDLESHLHRQAIGMLVLVMSIVLWVLAGLRPTVGLAPWKLLRSVSAYYYTGAVAAFVGILCVLAVFLLTYRGYESSRRDRVAAFIAGFAALLVALFPTEAPLAALRLDWWTDLAGEMHGGVHVIDLATIRPMVAHPGDPDRGIPSDPTNGALIADIGDVRIDIAYAGSCTAGKVDDFARYARVLQDTADAGRRVADGVKLYIQYGSVATANVARAKGWDKVFERVGATVINPGCGACIGCGPGVSERSDQVTVSAINRNYQGRSGPGKLWLASPLTVAASAIEGRIVSYRPGMFARREAAATR